MFERPVTTYHCNDDLKESNDKKDSDLLSEMAKAAAAAASATVIASEPIIQSQRNLESRLMEMNARINELQSLNVPHNSDRIKHLEDQLDDMLEKRLNFVEQLQIEHIKSQRKFHRLAKENSAPTKVIYCPSKEPGTPRKMSKSAQVSKESLLSTPSPRTRAPKPIKLNEIDIIKSSPNQNNNSKVKENLIKSSDSYDLNPTREKSSPIVRATNIVDKLQNLNDSIKETALEVQDQNSVNVKKPSPIDAYFVRSELNPVKEPSKTKSRKSRNELHELKNKLRNISEKRNIIENNFETLFVRKKPSIGDFSEKTEVSKLVEKNIAKIKPQIDQYVAERLCSDGKKIIGKNHLQKNINLVKSNKQTEKKKSAVSDKEISKSDRLDSLLKELNRTRQHPASQYFCLFDQKLYVFL